MFLIWVFVRVKLTVSLLCVRMCILLEKAVPEMTYTLSDGTLNPTHLLTHFHLIVVYQQFFPSAASAAVACNIGPQVSFMVGWSQSA